MSQPTSPTIELTKTLIPVGTFILGLMVGVMRDWLISRRERKRMMSMLLSEMKYNHRLLNFVTPENSTQITTAIPEHIAKAEYAQMALTPLSSISSSVHDAYLSKLCDIRQAEEIYKAYRALRMIEEGIKMTKEDLLEERASMDELVKLAESCIMALGALSKAIVSLPKGKEVLESAKQSRGALLKELSEEYVSASQKEEAEKKHT